MIARHDEAKTFNLTEGVVSRILGTGGTLMMVENTFEKGVHAPLHDHPHEQDCYIVEGSFEFIIGEKTHIFNAGDGFYIAPHVPHACTALEEGSKIIDVFSPIREDFLKKAEEC